MTGSGRGGSSPTLRRPGRYEQPRGYVGFWRKRDLSRCPLHVRSLGVKRTRYAHPEFFGL